MRYMHPGLLADIQRDATTLTMLLRVSPANEAFDVYGVTNTNRDVRYNAGNGEILYSAAIGWEPTDISAAGNLSVDNAEAKQLMPVYDIPVSEEAIAAGMYDYATFVVYLVNYEDLTPGRHCVLHEGTIGKVSVREDGLSFVTELLGLSAKLKQEICSKYTKTCRAIEGTMPIGSPLPGPQVKRDWCGVDFTVYLESATVADVGLENTLTFQIDAVDSNWAGENYLVPGRVTFTTGSNAGRTMEVMASTTDGWITLRHELGFSIQVGDELEYRIGCTFIYDDADKGCLAHAGPDRIYHFKGYPRIPTENEAQLMTPGATVGPGAGGQTSVPYSEET